MFVRKLLNHIRTSGPVLDRVRVVAELDGLLARGGRHHSDSLLPWLANVGAPEVFCMDMDALREFVERIGHGSLADSLLANPRVADELKMAIGHKLPIDPDNGREAVELALSGELLEDAIYTVTVLVSYATDPRRFTDLPEDTAEALMGVDRLVKDLLDADKVEVVKRQFESFMAGTPGDWHLSSELLADVYRIPEVARVVDTVNRMYSKENRSLRLATLIYARMKGLNLEERDIDVVRETFLGRESPDIGRGVNYFLENAERILFG